MSDLIKEYGKQYHTYPVHTQSDSFEGAFKRFQALPTPHEVYEYALMGLPKYFPLTNEPIPVDIAEDALISATTEIEATTGFNVSEVTHFQSFDYIDGMFTNNYTGIKLSRGPATKIVSVQIKFPHTNNPDEQIYQTYTIPPSWIFLKRNKMNVIAGVGTVSLQAGSPSVATPAGIFAYLYNFAGGSYQPGYIEVTYTAGFEQDKCPAMVSDLVKTWAALRMLDDIKPVLFPSGSVSVGIDGVNQSVTYQVSQLLSERSQKLEQKKKDLMYAMKKAFGRSINVSFVGA